MEESGTYLEDFLLSTELLPNDLRRDFELMKELDKECMELNKDLKEKEENYLSKKRSYQHIDDSNNNNKEQLDEELIQSHKDMMLLRSKAKQKLSEKSAIALSMSNKIDQFTKKLDTDLAFFETELKGCGEFETALPKGAEFGAEVAFKVNAEDTESMILGKVLFYHGETGSYEILDVDDSKKYQLPESQVIVLDLIDSQRKLGKGEHIFALYPDTTSFYPAIVIQAPRKTALIAEPCVIVEFVGDEDITGIIPQRTVPLKYVFRPS
eukprot:gene17141-23601_t